MRVTQAPTGVRDGGHACIIGAEDESGVYLSRRELDAGRLIERPIQVGDRVVWELTGLQCEVVAIVDDRAWIRTDANGGYDLIRPLDVLARIPA